MSFLCRRGLAVLRGKPRPSLLLTANRNILAEAIAYIGRRPNNHPPAFLFKEVRDTVVNLRCSLLLDPHTPSPHTVLSQLSCAGLSCWLQDQRDDKAHIALPIVALCVVPPTESRRVHLVAIAESGVRYYFTTTERYEVTDAAVAVCGSCSSSGRCAVD